MSLLRTVGNLATLVRHPFASHPDSDGLVVVTGASHSHFKSLCQFLGSLYRHEPRIRAIAYDLGLAEPERRHLRAAFPAVTLRRFDFIRHPAHFNMHVNHGAYAWKPVILCGVLDEFRGCACWMDAGNIVTEPLAWIRDFTRRAGFYSPASLGCLADWTHPGTLEYLKVPADLLGRPNLNGACVAVRHSHPRARALVRKWKELALVEACIAPPGSSRANHRFDQAVLSVIAHQSGLADGLPPEYHGFEVHRDID